MNNIDLIRFNNCGTDNEYKFIISITLVTRRKPHGVTNFGISVYKNLCSSVNCHNEKSYINIIIIIM
jgi:hypothetical protein